MKKTAFLLCGLLASLGLAAQTLNVATGQVVYAHSAASVGDMTFSNGTTLTVEGRDYSVADITSISVDDTSVADGTVGVVYAGNSATVTVAGNLARYLSVSVSGANVSIEQSADLQQEVTYTLSGSSTNGSFYMDGSYKAAFVISNLTLTSASGAAIDIEDGKALTITLEGTSTLSDAAGGSHNAAFYVDGHATIGGTGTLNVSGLTKHAVATGEYLVVGSGTLNVLSAATDGLHVNERLQVDGGTLSISSVGDGIDVGFRGVNKGTKDTYERNGFVNINGGSISISTSGNASKGLKADSTVVVTAGTVTITTSGAAYYDSTEADISSSSALKMGGAYQQSGGNVTLFSTGSGGKGLNATGDISVSGGRLEAVTTGDRYKYSSSLDTKPQAVKTDGNISLTGGEVYAAVVASKATTLKTDNTLLVKGATMMAIGGKTISLSSGSQSSSSTTATISGGQTVSHNGVSFTVPSSYAVSAATVVASKP